MAIDSLILFHRDLISLRASNNILSGDLGGAAQLLLMHANFAADRARLVWLSLRVLRHSLMKTWSREDSTVIIILVYILWIRWEVPGILILKLVLYLVLTSLLATQDTLSTGLDMTWLAVARSISLLHTIGHCIVFVDDFNISLTQIVEPVVLARPDGREVVTAHRNSFHIVIVLSVLSAMNCHRLLLSLTAG